MRWLLILPILLSGCAISPVPKDINLRRNRAHYQRSIIEPLLQPGDIIFRRGNITVASGTIDFSQLVAKISDSDFSHAVLVYQIIDGEAVVADISVLGLQRFYLVDWLIDSQCNIVVKRLKPEYQHYLPHILQELSRLVKADPLYDDNFKPEPNGRFYCTEMVDYCFRVAGLPLADRIAIRDLPAFKDVSVLATIATVITDLSLDDEVMVAGNDEIGLFSSPYLEIVIDLRFSP